MKAPSNFSRNMATAVRLHHHIMLLASFFPCTRKPIHSETNLRFVQCFYGDTALCYDVF